MIAEEECTTIDGSNVARVPSYNGWTASYEYPGFVAWTNPAHPSIFVAATPDYHEPGVISVEISTFDGHHRGGTDVPWPVEGRTFVGYLVAMAPILDSIT